MKKFIRAEFFFFASSLLFPCALLAGPLAQSHVALDLITLSRDSGSSVDYVYDNNGTVNVGADDLPLGSTGSFDDDADTGYLISGGLRLNDRWAVTAGLIESEMDSADDFSSPNGRLEIFLSGTNEFDSAQLVEADYRSDLSGEEINAVYVVNESVDLLLGLGSLELKERFRILSDDIGTPGVGQYTINTKNDMQGVHVGVALDHMLNDKFGLYFIGKLGSYDNDTRQRQSVRDSSLSPRDNSDSSSVTSTVTNLRLGLNYHFNQQLVVDIGYYLVSLDNVALAEDQFDTSAAGSNSVDDDGEVDWDGYSLGLKYRF